MKIYSRAQGQKSGGNQTSIQKKFKSQTQTWGNKHSTTAKEKRRTRSGVYQDKWKEWTEENECGKRKGKNPCVNGGGHLVSKAEETHLWYSPAVKVMKAEGLNPTLSGAYLSPLPAGWWSVGSAVCGHNSSVRTIFQPAAQTQEQTSLTHTSLNINKSYHQQMGPQIHSQNKKLLLQEVFSWNLWSK